MAQFSDVRVLGGIFLQKIKIGLDFCVTKRKEGINVTKDRQTNI